MLGNMWALLAMSLALLLTGSIVAQVKSPSRTLVVNGRTAQAGVVQINGRDYVDLQVLASITNGSLGFQGERIILTLPLSDLGASAPAPATPPEPPTAAGFSQDFMKAGIEEIALMREWASPLAYAIQNGYPITEQWVAGYREDAASGLRLASVAAKTEAERKALQVLSNEFESVREWSSKLVEARKSMDTAKYALSAGAVQNDPLSQKIIACGRFLGSMLGSGTFEDNPSCH
jgi:hypothetical protein